MTRTDRLDQIHDRLLAAVEEMVSGADWQRLLEVARRFHTYSPNNVWLMLAQRPDATRVAGFSTWRSLGRFVRKGEKGVAILAPVVSRRSSAGAETEDRADGATDDAPGRVLRGFRVVHVFDVAQTDGEPLPEVETPTLLCGDAPTALWDALAAQVVAAGFTLERGDCDGANGTTDFAARTVRVRADVERAQAAKTLIHELAHAHLHDGTEYARGCRGRAEVEAESVAYLVCSAAGLCSDDYSFPYVAHWSGGDLAAVRDAAERSVRCARRILDALEPAERADAPTEAA